MDIDLDRTGAVAGDPGRRRVWPRTPRSALLTVGLALVLAVPAGAPAPGRSLTPVATLPSGGSASGGSGAAHAFGGGRLFVAGVRPGHRVAVAAYEAGTGRKIWNTGYDAEARSGVSLTYAGDVVLAYARGSSGDGSRTVAFAAGGGEPLWSRPGQVVALADGRTGLIREELFPPGSALPGDTSPEMFDGPLYFSSDGRPHDRLPTGVVARAVDLISGTARWTSPPLRTVGPAGRDTDDSLLIVTVDGGVETRSARTGALRHRFTALPADARPCGGLICAGERAHDPLSGVPLWRRRAGTELVRVAGHLVEAVPVGGAGGTPAGGWPAGPADLVRVVEPRTGRTLVDLTGWRADLWRADLTPRPLPLTRPAGPGRTWLALLEPGGSGPRRLEPVPYQVANCVAWSGPAARAGQVACRADDGTVRLWRTTPRKAVRAS
nr:PQQ-binding-like beta-propeller repeat protein [Micromonospora sp. DSM 115978]